MHVKTVLQCEQRKLSEFRGRGWTITHCYFANMGGFRVHYGHSNEPNKQSEPNDDPQVSNSVKIITGSHIAHGWTSFTWPQIFEEDLKNKGKTDLFAGFIAILQLSLGTGKYNFWVLASLRLSHSSSP